MLGKAKLIFLSALSENKIVSSLKSLKSEIIYFEFMKRKGQRLFCPLVNLYSTTSGSHWKETNFVEQFCVPGYVVSSLNIISV